MKKICIIIKVGYELGQELKLSNLLHIKIDVQSTIRDSQVGTKIKT